MSRFTLIRPLALIALGMVLSSCAISPQIQSNATFEPLRSGTLQADIAANDVLVVGEMHGTAEAPEFIANLAERLPGRTLVGVELSEDFASLDCDGGTFPSMWAQTPDGRASRAMRNLICKVRMLEKSGRAELVFFDSRRPDVPTFYDAAASLIFAKFRSGNFDHVLVLTGNYHSRNDEFRLGPLLRKVGLTVVTATMSTPAGTAWNMQEESGEIVARERPVQANLCPNVPATQVLWTEEVSPGFRWDRCLVFPATTASPPAVRQP